MGGGSDLNPVNLFKHQVVDNSNKAMGKGGKGGQQVDYQALASQQGQNNLDVANLQSRLNNPNMVTPYGNQSYTMGPDGRPIMTQTLSPEAQKMLESQQGIQQGGLDILKSDLPNIQSALSGAFGMPGSAQGFNSPLGTTQTDLGPGGTDVQKKLDYSGLGAMPTADQGYAKQVSDSLYKMGQQYLDPQFKQQQDTLDSTLANQGIVRNDAGWNKEQTNLSNTKQQAYGDLRDRSISGGVNAMQSLYNMALAGRQEGVGEINNQGQFANAAQSQIMQNLMSQFQAHNAGVAQQGNLGQMLATLANQARQQNYSEYTNNRTMPLNMYNSLLQGSQIQNPQFQPTQGTNITPAPFMQGGVLAGQQNAANQSAQQAQTGQVMSILGTAAMVFL